MRVCDFLHGFYVDLWLRWWWCWWWRAWRSETQLHYYTTDNMRKNSFTKGYRRVCISLIFYWSMNSFYFFSLWAWTYTAKIVKENVRRKVNFDHNDCSFFFFYLMLTPLPRWYIYTNMWNEFCIPRLLLLRSVSSVILAARLFYLRGGRAGGRQNSEVCAKEIG